MRPNPPQEPFLRVSINLRAFSSLNSRTLLYKEMKFVANIQPNNKQGEKRRIFLPNARSKPLVFFPQ